MKNRRMPRVIFPDRPFEIVGRAKPALAALDVDDCAKRALIGAAATEIEARKRVSDPADMTPRQYRQWLSFESRQVAHVVVDGL
jgi:hypothetical protein